MIWAGWGEFWAMGGYGFYVWGAYAVTALAIAAEIAAVTSKRRRLARELSGELPDSES